MSILEYTKSFISFIPDIQSVLALPFLEKKNCTSSAPVIQNSPMTSPLTRVAGLSGAAAVILGAYGSHVLRETDIDERRKKAFETGSRYHLIHSLALLAANQAKFPLITSALLMGGLVAFCGPCYHYSITGDEKFRKLTPSGGIMFILGWLSFLL